MTGAGTGRRTSPRIVAVHTVTFRQARQFVPLLIPVAATGGFGGGTAWIVVAAVAILAIKLIIGAVFGLVTMIFTLALIAAAIVAVLWAVRHL